jgi:mRNA interferase RelE/StbE
LRFLPGGEEPAWRSNADESGRQEPQPTLSSEGMARVTLTPAAARELDRLPLAIRARVAKVFERLERWPAVSGAKPMRRDLAGYHRIRTGDYRILFRVRGAAIVVERIGHREGFYDE